MNNFVHITHFSFLLLVLCSIAVYFDFLIDILVEYILYTFIFVNYFSRYNKYYQTIADITNVL